MRGPYSLTQPHCRHSQDSVARTKVASIMMVMVALSLYYMPADRDREGKGI